MMSRFSNFFRNLAFVFKSPNTRCIRVPYPWMKVIPFTVPAYYAWHSPIYCDTLTEKIGAARYSDLGNFSILTVKPLENFESKVEVNEQGYFIVSILVKKESVPKITDPLVVSFDGKSFQASVSVEFEVEDPDKILLQCTIENNFHGILRNLHEPPKTLIASQPVIYYNPNSTKARNPKRVRVLRDPLADAKALLELLEGKDI